MENIDEKISQIENFLESKLEETGAEGFIIGLSGGIDSALTCKLAVEAVGQEKVKAAIMPGEPSREKNMDDARELASELGIDTVEFEINQVIEDFRQETTKNYGQEPVGNLRARTRMCFLYLEANEENLLVLGSGNKTEIMLGYYTKYGDGAVDLLPLGNLFKTEVRDIARYIGLDHKFIEKTPTAGLWEGQTDESELGHPYEILDSVLEDLIELNHGLEETAERNELEVKDVERIKGIHESTAHKRELPPVAEID